MAYKLLLICVVGIALVSCTQVALAEESGYEKAYNSLSKLLKVQGDGFLNHWQKTYDQLDSQEVQLDQVYDRVSMELESELRTLYKDKARIEKLKPAAKKMGHHVFKKWAEAWKQVDTQNTKVEKEIAELQNARKFNTRKEWSDLIMQWVREREHWEGQDRKAWAEEYTREEEDAKKQDFGDKKAEGQDKIEAQLQSIKRAQFEMDKFKSTLSALQDEVKGIKTGLSVEKKELKRITAEFRDAMKSAKKLHQEVVKTHENHKKTGQDVHALLDRAHSQVFYTAMLLTFAGVLALFFMWKTRDTIPYIKNVITKGSGGQAGGYEPVDGGASSQGARGGARGTELDSLAPMRRDAGIDDAGAGLGDIDAWEP